jgi:hypothetical protein
MTSSWIYNATRLRELNKQGWEEKHSLESANEIIDSFNNIARISITSWHKNK